MSKFKRLYIVLFLASLGVSFWHEFSQETLHPTSWVFYTTNSSEIDINSLTKTVIIDFCFKTNSSVDCPPSKRNEDSINPLGAEYKGIWLDNSADIKSSDFDIRNQYFRDKVDELYSEYHTELARKAVSSVLKALLIFALIVSLSEMVRWISRGK